MRRRPWVVANAGRILLTAAGLLTVVGPLSADWNRSHVFNPHWPSHARFHGVVGSLTGAVLAALSLGALWLPGRGRVSRDAAAAVPLVYWGSFGPAALLPGSGVDDPPHRVRRLGGVLPINLFWAGLGVTLAGVGWVVDRGLGDG
ncbi:MAG: acetyltransferase [Candidatus Dormibacteraeota bacterium]|nr:acetyltransferase [Candidatus Dormibacteraeota bacterium]